MRGFISQDEEVQRLDSQRFYDVCKEAFRKGAELYTDGDEERIELHITKHQNDLYRIRLFVHGKDISHSLFCAQVEG